MRRLFGKGIEIGPTGGASPTDVTMESRPFPRAHIRRHEPSSDRPSRGRCRLVCPKAMGPSLAKMELSLPVTLRQIRRSCLWSPVSLSDMACKGQNYE